MFSDSQDDNMYHDTVQHYAMPETKKTDRFSLSIFMIQGNEEKKSDNPKVTELNQLL